MAETDWKYLQYNVETGQKRTGDGPSGGSSSLSDLDDTNISSPSDGQMLGYDETEGKWKNVAAPGGNVDDVEVNGVSVVNAQKVAEIKSYKEVTQAQYEALPDTKLSDNVLYAIKDGGQAVDGFPPLIYSDEEREIGVWRDGRPLYQKTSVFTHSGFSGEKNLMPIDSTWRLIKAEVFVYNSSNQRTYFFPYMSSAYDSIMIADGYLKLVSNDSWNANYSPFYITVYYTKTTDTPGSGTWTTQGTLAHHYSTEEHIIGTWIDGKPLYERVFDLGADVVVDYSAFTNTTINASQMKVLVDALGIYSTGATKYSLMANISNNIIRLQTDRNGAAASVRYVILQYTKTTD